MESFFIDQTMLKNLTAAADSIRTSEDLVPQDMPVLASHLDKLNSALTTRMAMTLSGQTQQASTAREKTPELAQINMVTRAESKPVAMKITEAAAYLNISLNKLREISDLGEIPCKKLNRDRYFSVQDLDKWIEDLPTWVN
jgi:excisionase family DNA binding protein